MNDNTNEQVYQEIENLSHLQRVMDDYLEDYNAMTNKPMSLVLFQNAIEHVSRISRIIAQPYGNALLVSTRSLTCSLTRFLSLPLEMPVHHRFSYADASRHVCIPVV